MNWTKNPKIWAGTGVEMTAMIFFIAMMLTLDRTPLPLLFTWFVTTSLGLALTIKGKWEDEARKATKPSTTAISEPH